MIFAASLKFENVLVYHCLHLFVNDMNAFNKSNVTDFIYCHYGRRNNLASLFGVDKTGEQSNNASLTYTAPTEPKKAKPTESSSSQQSSSSLLCACAVHAYK